MPDRRVDFLLVGGGIASASCARTLRDHGADGSIMIVGRERDAPYDRPPLSKGYLRGDEPREQARFAPPDWWQEQSIELVTATSVMRLDPERRVAKLSNRQEVEFDKALIATGAIVRRLRVPGGELEGIHYLRAFANADAIRSAAGEAEAIVTIGGSYIGCEVAATLASLGKRCTILMQEDLPLEHHFGRRVGGFVARLLEDHDIEIASSDELGRYEGSDDRVGEVVTRAGRRLRCGCAVVGVGVSPDTSLARSAGLELGERGGCACSSRLETSAPGIFAAGDVAEYDSPLHGGPIVVEHWDAALAQGRTAARNMLGEGVDHDVVPYFWSDLADWAKLEYVGIAAGTGEEVVRGSLDAGEFTLLWLDGDRLVGALSVGRPRELGEARRLIADRTRVEAAKLGDATVDLATI